MSRLSISAACLTVLWMAFAGGGVRGDEPVDTRPWEALLRSLPPLKSVGRDGPQSFQFEFRASFGLPDGSTGHIRYTVERRGQRQGLLGRSPRGLPVLLLNNEGMLAASHERPGELDFAEPARFEFRFDSNQPLGNELSFHGAGRRVSEIDVDLAKRFAAVTARPHEARFERASRTLTLAEPDGLTTAIRFRRRAESGFPVESFSQTTGAGRGVTLTNFFVGELNHDGSSGPFCLTGFRRDDTGRHARQVVPRVAPTDRWLAGVASPQRVAGADEHPQLVAAGERLERWIALCAALENRTVPASLNREPLELPVGYLRVTLWFNKLVAELVDTAVKPAMQVSRTPYRTDPVGYPRGLATVYVEAWLGYRRTRCLYDFLLRTIGDPNQDSGYRIGAISMLGRVGLPVHAVELAELDAAAAHGKPHVTACWAAVRMLLGSPREQELVWARSVTVKPDWPWTVSAMSVQALAACGDPVEGKDLADEFLAISEKLGDGNLWGADEIHAAAATPFGRRRLLDKLQHRELGPLDSKVAWMALESLVPPKTAERTAMLDVAWRTALDEEVPPPVRAIAVQVAAGHRPLGRASVAQYVGSVLRSGEHRLLYTLTIFAGGHAEVLLNADTGIPSLLNSEDRQLRRYAADVIGKLPQNTLVTQDLADAMRPVIGQMLGHADGQIAAIGFELMRRLHRPGVRLGRQEMEKAIEQARQCDDLAVFYLVVGLLQEVSGKNFVAAVTEPAESVPPPVGSGMEWWRSRRGRILLEVEKWWEEADDARHNIAPTRNRSTH